MSIAFAEFEFDLPGALLSNLIRVFDDLGSVELAATNVSTIPDEQGVYLLLLDGAPVYVGKTDGDAGLNKRLVRHSRKILHRQNLDPRRVTFKAVRIFVFTAVDLETDLIRHYGSGLTWNGSGFGSNNPGRERDTTKNKPENYDFQYPIDIDRLLEAGDLPAGSASDTLRLLRGMLPYGFRIEGQARHPDIVGVHVPTLLAPFSAREAIRHVVTHIPKGWQATRLLGYLIMYKENSPDYYPDAELIATS